MLRTIEIQNITPQELADEFCNMPADDQAKFFSTVYAIARTWPGAGWCQQSCSIIGCSDRDALDAIETLASHLPDDALARLYSNVSHPSAE